MSKPLDPEELFSSDKEKTFSNQDKLPPLPVPDLHHTLERYLDSVKPHVTPEEYRQTEFIVQQFASGVGKKLHQQLLEKAAKSRNWLEKWWDDLAYLETRDPVAPYVNFGGPGPYVHHAFPLQPGTQIYRAGYIVHSSARFVNLVREEKLKIDTDSKGNKMCMNQFKRAYGSCRIPGVQKDHLSLNFVTESEGETPRHLIVLCNERLFSIDCFDGGYNILTPPEISHQLQKIKEYCKSRPKGQGISSLTGLDRTTWAQVRNRLLALHPDNYHLLRTIETSLFTVSFDDACPTNDTEVFLQSLVGSPNNKWFDKSLNLIFYENGMCGSNCDHTPVDAMVLVNSTYYNDLYVAKNKGLWHGSKEVKNLPEPRELVFHVDEVVNTHVIKAKDMFMKVGNNLQLVAKTFTKYGRKFLRQHKLHPDTHAQLALQYAYYKIHKKPAPTYETATIRQFYHGRTETMRSCTTEAIEWCKAMCDRHTSVQTKYDLYQRAAHRHNQLMNQAQSLKGCDRHLLGLYVLARDQGMEIPQIFKDSSYFKSGGGGNFVLSTSLVGYTTVHGGVAPMIEHGYGSFYHIQQDSLTHVVTSWKSCKETDAEVFLNQVHQCLSDMGHMVEKGFQAQAKL